MPSPHLTLGEVLKYNFRKMRLDKHVENGSRRAFALAFLIQDSLLPITLSEISQAVREKYHMISPLTETQSTKEKSRQNITRDIEIKSSMTITRGEVGGDSGGKGFQELL